MFTYQRKAGTTDVSVVIRIIDLTDGTPETGVLWNTAGIDLEYRREGAASVDIVEATLAALTTAHTDGGFLHIGNGYYRLDLPDAACASGVTGVLVHGTVTGMVVIGCYIQLVAIDHFDGVRAGLTALPNAAADGAGGLPISDLGGLDLDALNTAAVRLTAARAQVLDDWINAGRLDAILDIIAADVVNLDGAAMRGTDSAALASVCTEARLAELAAANLPADVDTVLTRLSAARAGYLDNLSAGAVALASVCTEARLAELAAANLPADLDTLLTRLSALRAGYLDELAAANLPADVDTVLTRLSAARAGYLDELAAANLPADVDAILADTSVLGRRVTLTGTANAADTTVKITLTGGVATNDFYNGQLVVLTGGTGAGQSRTVLSYTGATAEAVPTRDWTVAPDGTTTFVVIGADEPGLLEAGVAAAGAAATITLDATASADNNTYKSSFIMITGGTGAGQSRLITAYNGTSKVANVVPNWITNPALGSIYQIVPSGYVDVGQWLGEVVTGDGDWAALKAETAAILADTNELQGDWANGGRLDLLLDQVITDIAALNNVSAAEVNAEMVDALATDTYAQPGQEAPAATQTLAKMVAYLYKVLRNRITETATQQKIYADDGTTVDQKATVSDDNVTYDRGELGSGP
jgi:energy-coupling factor transporter ATP-binding protein EcfA2